MTLALKGSPHDETEPKKATYFSADTTKTPSDRARDSYPAAHDRHSGKSKGFWQLN
jgi:hypothetical protein